MILLRLLGYVFTLVGLKVLCSKQEMWCVATSN